MSTETMQDRHRSSEDRLAALGRRIDHVRGSARGDKEKVNRSIERRLDAVRAKDAEIRTELRQMADEDDAAWDEAFREMDRELDQLDAEVVVLEAQMAADVAADRNDFERAVDEELQAYDRFLSVMDDRLSRAAGGVREHQQAAAAHARDRVQAARGTLRRAKESSKQGWESVRADVRAATEELDAAVIEAVADVGVDLTTAGTPDRER